LFYCQVVEIFLRSEDDESGFEKRLNNGYAACLKVGLRSQVENLQSFLKKRAFRPDSKFPAAVVNQQQWAMPVAQDPVRKRNRPRIPQPASRAVRYCSLVARRKIAFDHSRSGRGVAHRINQDEASSRAVLQIGIKVQRRVRGKLHQRNVIHLQQAAGSFAKVLTSTRWTMRTAFPRTCRVMCLSKNSAPGFSGGSCSQTTIAEKCREIVGPCFGETIKSPRLTSISSASSRVTDSPGTASCCSPS